MPGMHEILPDVSADIERTYAILPLYPRPHPLRPCVIAALGSALYCRYIISRRRDDLDALIPLLTEVLLLPLDPGSPHFSQTTKLFYKLACSLAFRFELSRSPEDLEYAIMYYRHLLALPPKAIVEVNPLEVLDNLTRLVAHRVQSTTEIQPDHADEMVDTFQKLAALDPSSKHVGSIAKNMGTILVARLSQYGRAEECERALELLTDVEKASQPERSPDFYVFHGVALSIRFQQTSLYDYCRQAITRFNKSLALLPSEHPLRPLSLMGIATVLHHRFTHDKQLRSLEEAITHSRAALSSCPPGHMLRPACLALLSGSLRWRYAFFGNAEFLREADSCVDDALSQDLPEPLRVVVANAIDESNAFIGGFQRNNSLEGLMEQLELQRQRLAKIPPGHPDQLDVLRSIALVCGARFHHTKELTDLEDEIEHHTMALAASPPDHYVRRMSLFSLGKAFQQRFLYDNQPRSLEESIRCCRDALALCPRGQMSRFEPLHTLALSLSLRSFSPSSSSSAPRKDFDESMALFQSALDDEEHAHPHARYVIASHWAACARVAQHPCTALAYETAMSLMQSSLALGPTLPVQHRLLRGRWGELVAVPLDCASYYIEAGALKRAVETLEQGRALLWSEMRGLRTSMDRLRLSDGAALAERFVAISEELESIATSAESPDDSERSRDDEHHTPDTFGRMMEKVRELERKRAEVTDQIRVVPGFEHFSRAVPFDALQTAAACGPVVIINHCRYRCDILIVLQGTSPVHIPTAEDFYSRTIRLKELLLSTRTKHKHALGSKQYQRALRFVLRELYQLVGRPVIEMLLELEVPEQSRVWWCPTSVLCSLPLHAAGPIESDGGGKRYFSDVYVSSYTPTLSALIESRKDITHTLDPPSLLIVAQPDMSLPGVWGEIEVIQKLAKSATTTMLLGPRATQTSVLKQLSRHRMAHFACHGTLEPERPFDAAFLLRSGAERLSLLDIVRSRLSTADFAMLSVCHAAEWTDAGAPDEALHLTAAMQYCGFRSVVGTLWAMADTDGQDLAEHFYKRVFAEEERGVPLGERSARALRDAVRRLRKKKGVSFERWVNFVHYGA